MISEGEERRRTQLSLVSDEDLSHLLIAALGTIKSNAEQLFHFPVSDAEFPEYKQFILHPMDFQTIDRNIRRGVYKSTDGLTADVKWILHNCYIYNSATHTLTKNANYFFKVAKTEMGELEVCPDCFKNYYQFNKTYFIETCRSPHRLVWARLKGHPFWPAKLVRVDATKREGDCRFFGAHDRAWVPFDSIFLLSEQYPWNKPKTHKNKLDAALAETRAHIAKLSSQFPGLFRYSEPKTPFNYADACLQSDDLLRASPASAAASAAGGEAGTQVRKKQRSDMITQNKDEGEAGELVFDDEERPLIIDAPVAEDAAPVGAGARKTKSASVGASSPSTGIKRKMSDSGKNKAISGTGFAVKKSSSGSSTQGAPGNGSGVPGSASSTSHKVMSGEKSKIPTKKAISSATCRPTMAPASLSSDGDGGSSTCRTNCQPVRPSIAGKRKESSASPPNASPNKPARIAESEALPAPSPSKKAKATRSRNQGSLLSSSTAVACVSNKKTACNTLPAGTQAAANGAMTAAAVQSVVRSRVNTDTETGLQAEGWQAASASPPDTSLPASSGKNCSDATATKGSVPQSSAGEVKLLKDEIKRLKDQVSKLMIEMRDMRESTESQISAKVSLEKEKALADLEARLSKSFTGQLEDSKRKQWCAVCLKEAIYFCCWNTSYCSYECQSRHWPTHMPTCQQNSKNQSTAAPAPAAPAASPSAPVPADTSQQHPLLPLTRLNQGSHADKKKS